MAYDGTLKFDTSIDTKSFQSGLNSMSKIAYRKRMYRFHTAVKCFLALCHVIVDFYAPVAHDFTKLVNRDGARTRIKTETITPLFILSDEYAD